MATGEPSVPFLPDSEDLTGRWVADADDAADSDYQT
jgi:hypothetical protein